MLTRVFEFERETKNKVRLKEKIEGQPEVIGTLYVAKWWLGDQKTLIVTLEKPTNEEEK